MVHLNTSTSNLSVLLFILLTVCYSGLHEKRHIWYIRLHKMQWIQVAINIPRVYRPYYINVLICKLFLPSYSVHRQQNTAIIISITLSLGSIILPISLEKTCVICRLGGSNNIGVIHQEENLYVVKHKILIYCFLFYH